MKSLKPMAMRLPHRCPTQLTVLSYNLLAPLYVRPIDERTGTVQAFAAFPWAEPFDQVLSWDVRRPQLLDLLRDADADLICLQEVQFERMEDGTHVLPEWLRLPGYEYVIPGQEQLAQMADRNKRVLRSQTAVGNALLYSTKRLTDAEYDAVAIDMPAEACLDQAERWAASRAIRGQSLPSGVALGQQSPRKKARSDGTTTRVAACVRGRAGTPLASLGRVCVSGLSTLPARHLSMR